MSNHLRAFKVLSRSDVGLVRDGNEDSALISSRLIAVADGMGGHAGGEVASRIAITALKSLSEILNDATLDTESREDLLMNISFSIDDKIANEVKLEPKLTGMGTTLTALHLGEKSVELLHIGDSRCYLWKENKLVQLSVDHTVMQELIDQGRITAEEALTHPQRSLLTQALMGDSGIDPVLVVFSADIGDRFLVCSDGLNGVLSDYEITEVIKKYAEKEEDLLDALIDETKKKGAPDNITILWAQIVDEAPKNDIELIGAAL
ncbi:MAG: protein phosphatase 2C domain-containing protein [Actinomycetes bacterium]